MPICLLDFEYTRFGRVSPLDVLDGILEGDAIASIAFEKEDEKALPSD